ncbi:stretch-activated Ca2+-permeable channel component-domain-containing protein [Trametes meyenii]|nr:stretch-activated Ca2+-permeable channel component-domain-containing protein [Trametes meyenii]
MLLPLSLLGVIQSFLSLVDAQQSQLVLERVLDISTSALSNPPTLRIPANPNPLFVTVALCARTDNSTRFFLTNDTSISNPGPDDVDSVNTVELVISSIGAGWQSNLFTDGGVLSVVKGSTPVEVQMLVSVTNATVVDHPLLGDTTSNQALVFSPPFDPVPLSQPTFPNYTLPSANLSQPSPPSTPSNFSLILAPTSSNNLTSLPRTACALRAAARANRANIIPPSVSQGLWLRDPDGWRWQWLVNGLIPKTNYTVFALWDGQLISSEPAYFVTKSATFNCPLAHSLPFCPTVAYAVPLVAPRGIATAHTADTIPSDVTDTLVAVMANFTTTLTSQACGRDEYSPLVTCADCQQAYRRWLCSVSFPRCGEIPVTVNPGGSDTQGAQVLLPALQTVKSGTTPRNPVLPAFGSDYQTLLPCLETCNAADRACPSFLQFKCPLPKFTAASSYGVGFIDSGEEGVMGEGLTGVAQDTYGNVWCNSG